MENGYIRLIVTRGAGSLGLSPNSCENPSVIIIANEIQLYPPELYEKGMEIITAATSRNFVDKIPGGGCSDDFHPLLVELRRVELDFIGNDDDRRVFA